MIIIFVQTVKSLVALLKPNNMEQTIKQIVYIDDEESIVKLTDADGINYSFFKKKKDGEETSAYKSFKELDLKIKDKARFNYAVNGKYNNIMSFISK